MTKNVTIDGIEYAPRGIMTDYHRELEESIAEVEENIPDKTSYLASALRKLFNRARRSEQLRFKWQKLITDVTPGGSEYCDPEYTANFLREMRNDYVKTNLELAKLKKEKAQPQNALVKLTESGLLETLIEMDKSMADDGDDPIAEPHIARIRAAIAKAEGR